MKILVLNGSPKRENSDTPQHLLRKRIAEADTPMLLSERRAS